MEIMKQAAVYCRTSRDDPDDPRLSIGTQIENGKALAKKLGYDVTESHVFVDQNLSGKLPPTRWQTVRLTKANHRPGLEGAMVALETGTAQALVIRHRDRLCRSLRLSIDVFGFLESHKTELYATDDTIAVSGNATARLQLNLLMAIAQYQLDATQEAVKRSKQKQKQDGLKMSPCFSLGYLDGKARGTVTTEGNEEAVGAVREVYQRYLDGETVGEIVRWLNAEKSHLHNTYGKRFYHSSVRRILTNPHYIGMVLNESGELIKSQAYDAIIDSGLFNRVKAAMRTRRNPKHGCRVAEHLLSGFLTCCKCGRAMTIYSRFHKTGKYRVGFEYKCKHVDCRFPKAFTMRESQWDKWIRVTAGNPRFLLMDKAGNSDDSLTVLCNKLEVVRQNRAYLRKTMEAGESKLEDVMSMLRGLDGNVAMLESKIAALQAVQKPSTFDISHWDERPLGDRREFLGGVIETIHVHSDFVILAKRGEVTLWVYPLLRRYIDSCPSTRPHNTLLPGGHYYRICHYRMDISPSPPLLAKAFPFGTETMVLVNYVSVDNDQSSLVPLVPLSLAGSVQSVCRREYRAELGADYTTASQWYVDGDGIPFRTE